MNILVRPIITEKSKKDAEGGKFTFAVNPDASKTQIEKFVEKVFGVNVVEVNTIHVHGKTKKFGKSRRYKKLTDTKKAVVKLVAGQTIDLFGTEKKNKKKAKSNK
ncbi:50S ribosomal protein L23 [Candidatus Microgenomates bacterium]|nr:50S ribosomal protein L23 [Candidatus Microgenomates bacterium]